MRINGYATIYKLNSDKTEYIPYNTFRCFYRLEKGSASEKGGVRTENRLVARIPAVCSLGIAIGDYIFAGEEKMPDFDRSRAMRICSISDNRVGTCPHYKVEAE